MDDFIDLSFAESQLHMMHDAAQTSLWDAIELFGMILDHDCPGRDLVGYYRPEHDPSKAGMEFDGTWYFPSDEDIVLELIDIDHPPKVDVAYDSKGVNA